MENEFLYQKIAGSIRSDILSGRYVSGDKLPTLRELIKNWKCTIGTARRAYQILSNDGLVKIHVGKGTVVKGADDIGNTDPLRRVSLLHRAEGFLLEVLTNGYSPDDVEDAVRSALDRWRVVSQPMTMIDKHIIRFAGSHDLAVAWMATHINEIAPKFKLQIAFSGSIGGLSALSAGEADIAGAHLWDDETKTYNDPFIKKIMPGIATVAVNLAHRNIGLIIQPKNLKSINEIADLTKNGVRFVNRQPGSGTRVWLDAALKQKGINPLMIEGYLIEKHTHSDVAAEIANNRADVGIGLEASARAYGLDFVFLTHECYDLIMTTEFFNSEFSRNIVSWLSGTESKALFIRLGGYDSQDSGQVHWI